MSKIKSITPRKIYDSNSYPTLEIEVCLDNGVVKRASAPKMYESNDLYRHYTVNQFGKTTLSALVGKSYDDAVIDAILKVRETFVPELVSLSAFNQDGIDAQLSSLNGRKNRFNTSLNVTLALSNAIVKAAAGCYNIPVHQYIQELFGKSKTVELPTPLISIFDGGINTNNNLNFQSIMILPRGAASFKESIRMGSEIFHTVKKVLRSKGYNTSIGENGGYAPIFCIKDNENAANWESIVTEAFDIIMQSITAAGYKEGKEVKIAINVDADYGFSDEKAQYGLTGADGKIVEFNRKEIVDFYVKLADNYPLAYIGNGLASDDRLGWHDLSGKLGDKMQIAGNNIFFNQGDESDKMARFGVGNNIIISLDRVNTLTDIFTKVNFANSHRYSSTITSGLGDTEDDIIADIAIGCGIPILSAGGVSRTEKTAKYNQVKRTEDIPGRTCVYKPGRI